MKKMKRLVAVLMICVMMFSVAACGKQGTAKKEDKKIDGKVCVLTPTLSWSEDQYRSGEKMAEKYPGVVEHLTLPDDFAAEQETGITQIMNVAKDPSFKALVICYGDSGILPAIKMAKKENPDLKVITAPVWDDPYEMADVIDLCIDANWNKRGQVIAEKAKKMGAERIIHYSFPTHLKMEEIAQRRETMKKTAKKLGMDFIDVTMPDPYVTSDGATNQFIKEDIPKEIKKYGKDTCIFSTYCPTQDFVIGLELKYKYIVAEQCCPTPTQGYPAGMNLKITKDIAGDYDAINKMISDVAKKNGVTGRLSTWPISMEAFQPEFATEVAIQALKGDIKLTDIDALGKIAKDVTGVSVEMEKLDGKYDNYLLYIMDSIYY
ncbi:DUF3798 domain-containing protein [Dorea sp. OM07-5]|uniref:DUF3798 domain-containing protein n=1 Tax=Dorea sp. OM07-5 TaxID=2293100 RepID=UPI001FAB2571|nr:DUF3798 domain-containing protein [Dorea sp. OM07-5]